MLIVYLTEFNPVQEQLLLRWTDSVSVWPRSYSRSGLEALPTDWWLLFSNPLYADIWLLKYPEDSRVVRTLFD